MLLITGASGFVGQALTRACPTNWPLRLTRHQSPLNAPPDRAEIIDVDLEQLSECMRACQGARFILHAAGATGSAAVTAETAMDQIVTNLVLTARVLQAAWAQKVEKVLIFGSTTGYPDLEKELQEEDMEKGPPPEAYFGYGWMRRYLESLGGYLNQRAQTEVIVLRPAAVYGPWDRGSHVIPSLMARARDKADPFEVWGTGREQRDFLYVDDLARACYLALERGQAGRPVHLASGQTTTIAELTDMILELAEHRPLIQYRVDRPTNILGRRFDLSRARQELGFEAKVPLRDGLLQTWRWFCRQT